MKINTLKNISFDKIYKAFNLAFSDYEFQINSDEFNTMLKRRGFVPDLSFAAIENDEIIAFTLNGIGNFNGILTAYDTGTGTLKEHRGKGLATKIFNYSIPFLIKANVQQYLLEVLQHNTKALNVYKNLGFKIVREFLYHFQDNIKVINEIKPSSLKYSFSEIEIEQFGSITEFWDFIPSWQNSIESIKRQKDNFISIGAFSESKIVGYCIFEPVSGDVTQIAVDKKHRRNGIASFLLQRMLLINKSNSIKFINTDLSCPSLDNFLKIKNIPLKGKQFEMIKNIKN